MIPKLIHYCWFGRNSLPESALNCIESWKKFFPEYKIIEWNEDNFDFSECRYAREAYEKKKYAFVSDYARYKIMYKFGGLYFDTDVEVVNDYSDIILSGNFMGMEETPSHKLAAVNPGLGFGSEPQNDFIKNMIDIYEKISFYDNDGNYNTMTIVDYTTKQLRNYGLKDDDIIQQIESFTIYPKKYFCPLDYYSGKLKIEPETHSIHHFTATWHSEREHRNYEYAKKISRVMPFSVADKIVTALFVLRYDGLRSLVKKIFKITSGGNYGE